ncbi:MAG: type II secretion system inner membrane protein GspF [Planctomycetes bacterium]|nr:type II secretion system inner membrane protein GspF [Planctomycetota bacterium]
MPLFEYTQLSKTGGESKGTIDASSLGEARQKLRAAEIRLVQLVEKAVDEHRSSFRAGGFRTGRVKTREVAAATRHLSTLLLAGIPLVEALSVLVEQLGSSALSRVLARVRDKVNEGGSLAEAFSEYPRIFPGVFVSMVKAGESTGALENVLARLADMYEKRAKLTNKVRSALTYPLLMAVVGCAVVLFVLSYVLPSITKLFTEMNMTLPWVTLFLIKLSAFLNHSLWLVLVGIVGLIGAHRYWLRTPGARMVWDRFKLKVPLFGPLLVDVAVARFSRTLGVLLGSGVTIVEALELSEAVVSNAVMADVIQETRRAVGSGQSVSQALAKDQIFPPVAIHMIAAGEKSGNMEDGLLRIADSLDNEIESKLSVMTSLLEPMMIIVLGGMIGFIVLAILLPIFDINSAIV